MKKRMILGLSLGLVALGLPVSPVVAAPALSTSDQAFLASLAIPTPVPAAKRPALGEKSLCNTTANCSDGTTVFCAGNVSTTSCSAADSNCAAGEPGHVTCDGVTTSCPPCPCEDRLQWCIDTCSPYTVKSFQCDPYMCRCNFPPPL